MYGVIHLVIKDMILSQFGQDALDSILQIAGLDESTHFKMFLPYDDSVLEKLLKATSQCLGQSVERVLEEFGDYFIMYCLRHSYDEMLRTLGSDISSFIQNLDSLHSMLALSYEKMVAPSFRCDNNPDGSLTLHYHSPRRGYYPLVKGLIIAVAREIFNQDVKISLVSRSRAEVDYGLDQEHAIFHVDILNQSQPSLQQPIKEKDKQPLNVQSNQSAQVSCPSQVDNVLSVSLTKDQFVAAFPFHLIFDDQLILRQFGQTVARLSPVPIFEGMLVTDAFRVIYPRISLSVENICRFINAVFIIGTVGGSRDIEDNKDEEDEDESQLFSMKGQMIRLEESKLIIFIGSPRLTSLQSMKKMKMYMSDIPLYDVTREMVLLYQQRNAEIGITRKLDETTAELMRTSRDLELEKKKTEELLYQMIPEKVANQLKNGQRVEAEKYEQVTILFSDIVGFTSMAAACSPLDVINMLNDLYHRFDLKTNVHKVYKVETIGDAYMVVSGCPDITAAHAQRVADFSLDMVEQANCVTSPATGKPLQIRVGIHTGPVVAGVVGVKMPRYCLFGDTVNTASRMESHGVPGRIHTSPQTFRLLHGQDYKFRTRPEVTIKGKGKMRTYFLLGHGQGYKISEPDDQFVIAPMATGEEDDAETTPKNRCPFSAQLARSLTRDQSNDETVKQPGDPMRTMSLDDQSKASHFKDHPIKQSVADHVSNDSVEDQADFHATSGINGQRNGHAGLAHSDNGTFNATAAHNENIINNSSSQGKSTGDFQGLDNQDDASLNDESHSVKVKNRHVNDERTGRFTIKTKMCIIS